MIGSRRTFSLRGSLTGQATIVAVLAAVTTALWLLPITTSLTTRILTPNTQGFGATDGTSSLTEYWSVRESGKTPFTLARNEYIAAPDGVPRSPVVDIANPLIPGLIWLLQPLLGLVAAWNLVLFAGFVATATCTFVLLCHLGVRPFAASAGAYIVAFSPWMMAKAKWGHLGLLHFWPVPLAALFLARALQSGSRRSLIAAGGVIGIASYVSFYIGVLALLLAAVTLVAYVVHSRSGAAYRARKAGLVLLTTAVVLMPIAILARFGETTIVVERGLEDFIGAGMRWYLIPPPENPVFGSLSPGFLGASDRDLYAGTTTLVAAVAAVIIALVRPGQLPQRLRDATFTAAACGVIGLLLALPLEYAIRNWVVPTPSLAATTLLPEFRTMARYGTLTVLGLALAAAVVFHLLEGLPHGRTYVLAVIAATALQLAAGPPIHTWETENVPAHVGWLRDHPRGIVAVYPMLRYGLEYLNMETEEYAFQRLHGHPLFNLYGGDPRRFLGTRQMTIRAAAKFLQQPETAPILAAQGVRYVVVRLDAYRSLGDQPPPTPGMRLTFADRTARIYEITAEPLAMNLDDYIDTHRDSIAATLGGDGLSATLQPPGFYDPETDSDGTVRHWLRGQAAIRLVTEGWNGQTELSFRAWSAGGHTRRLTFELDGRFVATATISGDDGPVRIRLPQTTHGTTTIRIQTSPGPERLSATDARIGSIYLSQPEAAPVLVWRKL